MRQQAEEEVLSHAALQTRRYIWAFKGLVPDPEAQEEETGSGADQGYSKYNIQFFWFNINRSSKAYYFRLYYDQWATVGFRLFKTKAPSFLPAGLQKGKNLS